MIKNIKYQVKNVKGYKDFLNSLKGYESKKDYCPGLPSALTERGFWYISKMKGEDSQVVCPSLPASAKIHQGEKNTH